MYWTKLFVDVSNLASAHNSLTELLIDSAKSCIGPHRESFNAPSISEIEPMRPKNIIFIHKLNIVYIIFFVMKYSVNQMNAYMGNSTIYVPLYEIENIRELQQKNIIFRYMKKQ
jgi:hypothetical protein